MEKIPEPPVLTLDPNDENIILNIPEDREPSSESESQNASKKEKVLFIMFSNINYLNSVVHLRVEYLCSISDIYYSF